jgi:biotin operon repressor
MNFLCNFVIYQSLNTIIIFMKEQVLQAMREAGKPVSAGEITKVLNADRKEVDKAFAELKKSGAIVSPVRCKWTPAE